MTTEQAINEIVSSGYGQAQCHKETMCMAVDALRAQQERENRNPQWISVKDGLPENEEDDVLIYCRETEHYGLHKEKRKVYHAIYKGAYDGDRWYTSWCYGCKYIEDVNVEWPDEEISVTHWMPLPEPPAEAALKEQEAQHDN